MNMREDDQVSAVALVMEEEADTSAVVHGDVDGVEPIDELPPEPGGDAPEDSIGGIDVDPAEVESPEEDDPDEPA